MSFKRILPLSVLLCSASFFSINLYAGDTEFKSSYQAYLSAVKAGDKDLSIEMAETAYNQGLTLYGEESLDSANLALNWANAILNAKTKHKKADPKAKALFLFALKQYEKSYGNYGVELVDPLLGLATASHEAKERRNIYTRVLDIAEQQDNALLLADMKIETVLGLAGTPEYTAKVLNYVFSALETYRELLPEDALKRVKATYLAATIRFAQHKREEATALFEEVVKQFDKLNYDHPYELASHAKLVELYERQGESDKSTKHCLAIGAMKPWADAQEQVPLFRTPPKYPRAYLERKKTGMAQIAFKVNKQGFVIEPEVITYEGGQRFAKAAIKALEGWRYAPKFEGGEPVVAESRVQIDFNIR